MLQVIIRHAIRPLSDRHVERKDTISEIIVDMTKISIRKLFRIVAQWKMTLLVNAREVSQNLISEAFPQIYSSKSKMKKLEIFMHI